MEQLHLDIFQYEYEDICRLYWELESEGKFTYKVSEIAKIFGLKTNQIPNIIKKSCIAYSSTVRCILCDEAYQLVGRNDFDTHNYNGRKWKCKDCLKSEHDNIVLSRQNKIKELIERMQTKPIDIENLSLKECVYLLALIRHSADEMLVGFHAVSTNKIEQLMPQSGLEGSLIYFLYKSDLISLSYESPESAFNFEKDILTFFSLVDAMWQIEFKEEDNLRRLLQKIEQALIDGEFITKYKDELLELITEISLMECLAFLEYNLEEHNLSFQPGEKTKVLFTQLLESYSVSQIYIFIWRACKDAAAYYMKGGISKKQAANSVVGSIQRQYERAVGNNWTIGSFKRNYKLPQSILSQVVFNFMLRTDDGGFNQKISSFM